MGVNAGTTFTRSTMNGGSGSEGEAEEALGSSGIGDREHGTMMRGGDSSEGEVGTLMGVREDEGTVRGGGLVEHVQPPSTVKYSREALLCTGETLAEFRGLGDGRVRGGRVREGMLIDVVSEGSEAGINIAVGRAHSNSEGQGGVRDVSSGKGNGMGEHGGDMMP